MEPQSQDERNIWSEYLRGLNNPNYPVSDIVSFMRAVADIPYTIVKRRRQAQYQREIEEMRKNPPDLYPNELMEPTPEMLPLDYKRTP